MAGLSYGATTAVFSDGNYMYSSGGNTNLVRFSRATEYSVLTWSSGDLQNKAVDLFGTTYNEQSSGVIISNGAPQTLSAYNAHVVIYATNITATGTVAVSGNRVNEDDGSITNFSENVIITATNYYQTSAKFVGTVTNSTTDANIICDLITTSYFDFQNQDFSVLNIRAGFKPSNPSWDIGIRLYLVDNDGKLTSLVNNDFQFDSGDAIPRAANGVIGHAKRNVSSRLILGSENEGIVVKLTGATDANPANMTEVDITIGCELK